MSSDPQPVAFQAPTPEQLAPSFPGYRIESLIATGGMGAVYKAIQVSLDRPVAIKILPQETSSDASFRESFTLEAKAMARLNHPNLIGVYDFGEVDGILFIIMEFVAGQSLYHATHGQPVASREAARLISEVCAGLAHAHEHGIIHRDIKPSNILLDQHGRPKIGDFGLAHPIGRVAGDGEMIFGTPHYTAPEVLARPKAVGPRADIFSVGVMLHELLTSVLPDVDLRPASAVCGCDIRFDAIIKKATHPVPEMRYQSASQIVADLTPLLQAHATVGHPAGKNGNVPRALSAPVHPRRKAQVRQQKNSSGIWIVIFLLLAAGVAFFFRDKLLPSQPQVPDKSEQETPNLPDLSQIPVGEGSKKDKTGENPTGLNDLPSLDSTKPPVPHAVDKPSKTPTHSTVKTPTKTKESSDEDTTAKASTFDMAAFLDRARKVMQEKAKTPIDTHDKALAANLDTFLRGIKRAIRKLENSERYPAEQAATAAIDEMRANGNRMPAALDKSKLVGSMYAYISGDLGIVQQEALDRQTAADRQFEADLSPLCEVYISGLEFHIAKLQKQGDEVGAKELEHEAVLSRNNPQRFTNIILGRDPDYKAPAAKGKPTTGKSATGN